MKHYVVDTHALVWYLNGDSRLSKRAGRILESDDIVILIPTIVLAEIKYLFKKKRIRLSFEKVMKFVVDDPRAQIYPFDINCVEVMNDELDIHDAAIVSVVSVCTTMLDIDAELISKDKDIAQKAGVKIVW